MDDVVVVGAGPAGSIAALVLARAGATVRLVDRESFPRAKLCGDTVNPGTLSLLDALGMGERVRHQARPISGMMVTGPRRTAIVADYPRGLTGAAITRAEFDCLLLEAAVHAGVRFDDGVTVIGPVVDSRPQVTGVRVVSSGSARRTLNARVVIGADGRGSRLARATRLTRFAHAPRRWAFGAYFTDVAEITRRGEMHVRADGYIGLAPLPGAVVNLCVVHDIAQCGHADAHATVSAAIDNDARLRERFAMARQISPVVTLGPLALENSRAGCPGLLLAGDAAGFIDPMTGDGLRFAVRGGELAAQAALRELHTGEPAHQSLLAQRRREFARKWRVNRALRWLTSTPRALQGAALVAGVWDAPFKFLVGVAGDCATVPRISARFFV